MDSISNKPWCLGTTRASFRFYDDSINTGRDPGFMLILGRGIEIHFLP